MAWTVFLLHHHSAIPQKIYKGLLLIHLINAARACILTLWHTVGRNPPPHPNTMQQFAGLIILNSKETLNIQLREPRKLKRRMVVLDKINPYYGLHLYPYINSNLRGILKHPLTCTGHWYKQAPDTLMQGPTATFLSCPSTLPLHPSDTPSSLSFLSYPFCFYC